MGADMAEDAGIRFVLKGRPEFFPQGIVEIHADSLEDAPDVFFPYRTILVVQNFVAVHPLHQLQDEFTDDIPFVRSQIDSPLFHALQFVEMILQFLGRVEPAFVVFGQHARQPSGVLLVDEIARPCLIIRRHGIVRQVVNGKVGKLFIVFEELFRAPSVLPVCSFVRAIIKCIGIGYRLLHATHHILFLAQFLALVPVLEVLTLHQAVFHFEEVSPRLLVLRVLSHEVVPIVVQAVQLFRLLEEHLDMPFYLFSLLRTDICCTCRDEQQCNQYLFHFLLRFVWFSDCFTV